MNRHQEVEDLLQIILNFTLLLFACYKVIPEGIVGVHDLNQVHFKKFLALFQLKKLCENGFTALAHTFFTPEFAVQTLASSSLAFNLSQKVTFVSAKFVVAELPKILVSNLLKAIDVQLANKGGQVVVLEVNWQDLCAKQSRVMNYERKASVTPSDDMIN